MLTSIEMGEMKNRAPHLSSDMASLDILGHRLSSRTLYRFRYQVTSARSRNSHIFAVQFPADFAVRLVNLQHSYPDGAWIEIIN